MRVAMLSGGKDSLYAALKSWPIDLGVMLIYSFPIPSPHILNMGKSIETLIATGIPVITLKLSKGKERDETIRLLSLLGTDEIVAGDVYIEDHLKYMESIAKEVGAKLKEPLWGEDPEELTYEIFSNGFEVLIIGTDKKLKEWLGKELSIDNLELFLSNVRKLRLDPLGENGEYHTLVINSPLHNWRIDYEVVRLESLHNYMVIKVL